MEIKEKFNKGDKVRVVDASFQARPQVWNKELVVMFSSNGIIHVTDHLEFPVFINSFRSTQLKKVK